MKTHKKILYYSDHLKGKRTAQAVHSKEFVRAVKEYSKFSISYYPPISKDNMEKNFSNKTKKIFLIPGKIKKFLINKREWRKLKKVIKKEKPDVIIARHNFLFISVIKKLVNIPLPFILEVNGLVEYSFNFTGKKKQKKLVSLENEILEKSNFIFTISEIFKSGIISKGFNENKVAVFPNAVDVEKFNPSNCETKENKNEFIIGYIGSSMPGRDIKTLIEAYKIVKKKLPDTRLELIGNFKSKCNIEGVVYRGTIAHDNIPKEINRMDITVAPYFKTHTDRCSPLKILEYMAMEKPVITTKGKMAESIFLDETEKHIYIPENPKSLANVIIKIYENDELRKEMGVKARGIVMNNFNYKRYITRLDKICEENLIR